VWQQLVWGSIGSGLLLKDNQATLAGTLTSLKDYSDWSYQELDLGGGGAHSADNGCVNGDQLLQRLDAQCCSQATHVLPLHLVGLLL